MLIVLINVFFLALRYTTNDGQYKESAVRLTNALVNIRAIINHFSPKVDSWAASNHLASLTEEQVRNDNWLQKIKRNSTWYVKSCQKKKQQKKTRAKHQSQI